MKFAAERAAGMHQDLTDICLDPTFAAQFSTWSSPGPGPLDSDQPKKS